MNSTHRIKVLGRDLQVKSMAPPETVREIEAFVNVKLAEVVASVKGGDAQIMAILALMNIAETHLALIRKHEALKQQNEDAVSRLLQRLTEVGE